jgi:hypothetical protein
MEFSLAPRSVRHQFAPHCAVPFSRHRFDPCARDQPVIRHRNPRAEAAIIQELNDAASEISAVKGDVAQLQNDVDSLRQVVAKQDTVISRLVEVTHVPR